MSYFSFKMFIFYSRIPNILLWKIITKLETANDFMYDDHNSFRFPCNTAYEVIFETPEFCLSPRRIFLRNSGYGWHNFPGDPARLAWFLLEICNIHNLHTKRAKYNSCNFGSSVSGCVSTKLEEMRLI